MLDHVGVRLGIALAVVCLNALILLHFHDRFWWPPDEGNYAHVAERVLDGEVLHADIQDIHPGYVNFMNAAALGVFGRELLSMRYPLVALGIAQCAIVFAVLMPLGLFAASVGATTITALGFVQFLDPTAHWYALFLVILLAGVLHLAPRARWRLEAIGAIVMTAVLFRQLSGVFIAMGAITLLLVERDERDELSADRGTPWLARILVGVMLLGLTGYLIRSTEEVGWLLFGIWPVLLLLRTGWTTRRSDRDVVLMVGRLARGGAVAALPLLAYHIAHGSLGPWYRDSIVTATQFPRMPFFDTMNYAGHVAAALDGAATGGVGRLLNGVFWVALTVMAAIVGTLVLRGLLRPEAGPPGFSQAGSTPALPVLAVFYAVVSVHYQIPIYLTYSAGLSTVALIWLTRGARSGVATSIALAALGLYFNAGQPLSRVRGATNDAQPELVADTNLRRLGLHIEPSDNEIYGAAIALIHREVPPGSTIFAVPSHAELYFLSARRNPFRFFNTALGVRTQEDLDAVLGTLDREPPVLVFYNRRDKYNTRESRMIMERVEASYESLPSIGHFEIFRRPGSPVAGGPPTQSSRK